MDIWSSRSSSVWLVFNIILIRTSPEARPLHAGVATTCNRTLNIASVAWSFHQLSMPLTKTTNDPLWARNLLCLAKTFSALGMRPRGLMCSANCVRYILYFWWRYVLPAMTCKSMVCQQTRSIVACLKFLDRPKLPSSCPTWSNHLPRFAPPCLLPTGFELYADFVGLLSGIFTMFPGHLTRLV